MKVSARSIGARAEKFIDFICIGLMSVAFGITFAHIIGRYILRAPIFYSEELARYCFIWACMLGASIVHRDDEHTAVTYFVGLLPQKAGKILYIMRSVVILLLLIGLVYQGARLSYVRRGLRLAALRWSWTWLYSALPAGALLMIFSTIKHIRTKVRELRTE